MLWDVQNVYRLKCYYQHVKSKLPDFSQSLLLPEISLQAPVIPNVLLALSQPTYVIHVPRLRTEVRKHLNVNVLPGTMMKIKPKTNVKSVRKDVMIV